MNKILIIIIKKKTFTRPNRMYCKNKNSTFGKNTIESGDQIW